MHRARQDPFFRPPDAFPPPDFAPPDFALDLVAAPDDFAPPDLALDFVAAPDDCDPVEDLADPPDFAPPDAFPPTERAPAPALDDFAPDFAPPDDAADRDADPPEVDRERLGSGITSPTVLMTFSATLPTVLVTSPTILGALGIAHPPSHVPRRGVRRRRSIQHAAWRSGTLWDSTPRA
jgi:hypothetical protein